MTFRDAVEIVVWVAVLCVLETWARYVVAQVTDYYRHWQAGADPSLEDAQATKGMGSFS